MDPKKPSDGEAEAAEKERVDALFEQMKAAYAALTPEERAEEKAELAAWDGTLKDGLEDEPWGDWTDEDLERLGEETLQDVAEEEARVEAQQEAAKKLAEWVQGSDPTFTAAPRRKPQ